MSDDLCLTKEQAEKLMDYRGQIIQAVSLARRLATELSDLCPHNPPLNYYACPVCTIYKAFMKADNDLHDIDGYLDHSLERAEIVQ